MNEYPVLEGKKRRKAWKVILLIFLLMVAAGLAYVVPVVLKAPRIDAFDAVPKGYRSSVLDDQGEVVLNLSGESSNRVYVKINEIPADLQHAIVSIEDARFYKHHGIDLIGLGRAVFRGIKSGGMKEGASTLTQQLLKNNVFTDWTSESTFRDRLNRKLQEQYLAVMLERKVDKDWILENYVNTINLGGGNWGAETAARYYFDKDVSDLTLSECAVLAAVIKNPTTYNPVKNPDNNAARRETVLKRMLEEGYITEEQQAEALADPVYERIAEVRANGPGTEIMTYFEDALVNELISDLQEELGCSEEDAWNQLYKGGLTIHSTENSRMQEICDSVAENSELFGSDEQVSIVMVDNETGQIKAMIGGRGKKEASLVLNRAIDGQFQPGSAIKIIGEYAAGLNKGAITLGTAVDDAPYTYTDGTVLHNASGTFAGMTTVRDAIVTSNNIVALKCFQKVGMDEVFAQLQRFGISTLTDADKVEALALGGTSGGVTNLEMTAAYATIARGGMYREPVYYTTVEDRDGNVILSRTQETHEAVSGDTASLLTDALEDVVSGGTGQKASFEGTELAGKSGTTNDVRDAWFIGYSPYCTCGVWGGFDDHSPQESSAYVQQVWKAVMTKTHEDLSTGDFSQEQDLEAVKICKKCGNLAVEGLCDHTVQGDETCTEYFAPGTAPTESCSCHVAVKVCTESGQKAGSYCTSTEERVYLKSGTAETEDAKYVLPDGIEEQTCQTHRHFWSDWYNRWKNRNSRNSDPYSGNGSSGNENGDGDYRDGDADDEDHDYDSGDDDDEDEDDGGSWFGGNGPSWNTVPESSDDYERESEREEDSGQSRRWWERFFNF